jgi:hypothetical protein
MYGIQPKQNKRRGLQEKIYIYISKSKRRKQSKRRRVKKWTQPASRIYTIHEAKSKEEKKKKKKKRVSQR